MKLEFSPLSFLLGCAVGAGAVLLAPRLKPVLVEVMAGSMKLWDAAIDQLNLRREDLEDLVAEARARARGETAPGPEARTGPVAA
jgi:hypothetical protein